MAIQFARARYISRMSGGNAVRSAAYNARAAITAERTGELFHFRHRGTPEHHAVLLPAGAASHFEDSAALWNGAETAEKRKDAQVAREIVLALPANRPVSDADRIELARTFAVEHFVSKGLAVQVDVHAPHAGRPEDDSERANWHAHLLITTRRVEGAGFSAKKARDLNPEVRRSGHRAVVTEGEAWANSGASTRTGIFRRRVWASGWTRWTPTRRRTLVWCGCAGWTQPRSRTGRRCARPTKRPRAIRIRCWPP